MKLLIGMAIGGTVVWYYLTQVATKATYTSTTTSTTPSTTEKLAVMPSNNPASTSLGSVSVNMYGNWS